VSVAGLRAEIWAQDPATTKQTSSQSRRPVPAEV
jgi:hypothetical protein